jgi:hypothetical protein
MLTVPRAENPIVLSYLALRKFVGWIALLLPFALIIPWLALGRTLPVSISGYYYTGLRNLLIGSLCAISMYMLGCRGYDRKDEIAGTFSALCALGVAFFPAAPEHDPTPHQLHVEVIHYVFAILLFSTLVYFCLVLFKMTAAERPTPQKIQRNHVYTVSGYVIVISMLLIVVCKLLGISSLVGLGPKFCLETTSLLAFGIAWLVKGETFFKDQHPEPSITKTTDGGAMVKAQGA